jgi:hypothetical protein
VRRRKQKPQSLADRMPANRRIELKDIVGPVRSDAEQRLFQRLYEQRQQQLGGLTDWTAFTREYNDAVWEGLMAQPPADLTFKSQGHILQYHHRLLKAARQAQSAGMAQSLQAAQPDPPPDPLLQTAAAALAGMRLGAAGAH